MSSAACAVGAKGEQSKTFWEQAMYEGLLSRFGKHALSQPGSTKLISPQEFAAFALLRTLLRPALRYAMKIAGVRLTTVCEVDFSSTEGDTDTNGPVRPISHVFGQYMQPLLFSLQG